MKTKRTSATQWKSREWVGLVDPVRGKRELELQNSTKALVDQRGANNETRDQGLGCWELSRQTWRIDREKKDKVWQETTGTWKDLVDDVHKKWKTIPDSYKNFNSSENWFSHVSPTTNSEYSDLQQRMNVLKTAADLPTLYLFALKAAYVREQILWIELAWYGVSSYLM